MHLNRDHAVALITGVKKWLLQPLCASKISQLFLFLKQMLLADSMKAQFQ
jgi:hypothetical protein